MRKTQEIGLLAIVILTCAAAAIPIDPNPGNGAVPQTTILQEPAPSEQEDMLPLAGLLAAVGAIYALSATQTGSSKSAPDDATIQRHQSMADATKKKLADLESRVVGCRKRMIRARQKSSTSWETRSITSVYDKLRADIKETKESLSTLEAWGTDLRSTEFCADNSIRFRNQTYYYSDGLVRRITANEAYGRFEKAAKAAYAEFCSEMKSLYAYLQKDLAAEGGELVDAILEALDSTQKAFMQRIKDLRDEYTTERGGLQGQWKKYFDKLNDDYFCPLRDESKDLLSKLTEKAEKLAYDVLTPTSVKYEIERQEREALKDEKERLHDRKRRWSMQLRDRAKRTSKEVLKDLRRVYDRTIFSSLKTQVEAWRDKALDDARKMKWQRTEEKAEARCQEIDQRISGGRTDFLTLAHQKAVAALSTAYYAPKIEAATPKTSVISRVVAKKRSQKAASSAETPKAAAEEADPQQTTQVTYLGATTTTPTTTSGGFQMPDLWQWLTEEQDRSGAAGSDIFRAVGGNIIGRGALDILLGVYVKDDGGVTTTRLDTLINMTVIAGPILRGTALGAKLCGWAGKTVAGGAKAVGTLKLSKQLTKIISYVDDAAKYLLKQSTLAKKGLEYAKSTYSRASSLLGLSVPALKTKLDDMLKLTDDVSKVTSKVRSKVTSALSGLKDGVIKLEKTAETLTKPHGFEELLGKFSNNKSLTKHFSDLGKTRGIEALYGGLNASYTRLGLSGLVKATVGRPFEALTDAGRILVDKVPKSLKADAGKLLSQIGFTSAEQAKASSILKGFDDAATTRSASYGNEATEAAESLVQQADELYQKIESKAEEVLKASGAAVN